MILHTRFKTGTTSFANSFLLLVMVAGVLDIDLFESVSGYHHKILPRVELVFSSKRSGTGFPLLSISEYVPGNDAVKECILPLHRYASYFGAAFFFVQNSGQVSTRPFYSSHNHASLSNIPHQNSDEDEAFILPVDVV
jgi:hypothetical protein